MLYRIFVPILFTAALVGCNAPPLPPPPPLPPTRVVVAQPTVPPAPSATFASPTSAGTTRIKIFLIAIDDGGKSGKKIGCNDSVVGVERTIPPTQVADPAIRSGTPLATALTELFSIHDRTYGQSGLYNALYQSTLKVDSVSIGGAKATINLSGKTQLGGVCDNPRFKAQIEETALQFSTVSQVDVFVNNIPIDKLLSEK